MRTFKALHISWGYWCVSVPLIKPIVWGRYTWWFRLRPKFMLSSVTIFNPFM